MFHDLLIAKIKELGLNYEKASSRTGVSSIYLSLIGRGKRLPSDKVVIQLAKGLGADKDEWLRESWKEKAKSTEAKKYFEPTPPKYPHLRKSLLDSYDSNIFKSETPASLDYIKEEFEKYPEHPLEPLLLKLVMTYLQKKGKAKDYTSSKGYSYILTEESKNKRIEQAGLRWVYDKRLKFLTYTFKDSKSRKGKKIKRFHLDLKYYL
ncbi:MAG: helix-turn-helix transcriptional regulator [Candidatus Omnitrophica bacterium]|nr:helix-turn-helix transcriptional regulator [Candidatus Omnitrophota bacterium]